MAVTRPQIERLSARIEALAAASETGVAYIWRNLDETKEEACERHYQSRPGDRGASQTYVFSWLGAQKPCPAEEREV
jgi:hypothetical protein